MRQRVSPGATIWVLNPRGSDRTVLFGFTWERVVLLEVEEDTSISGALRIEIQELKNRGANIKRSVVKALWDFGNVLRKSIKYYSMDSAIRVNTHSFKIILEVFAVKQSLFAIHFFQKFEK